MLNTRIKIHEKNNLKKYHRQTKKFMNFLISGYIIQHQKTTNQHKKIIFFHYLD